MAELRYFILFFALFSFVRAGAQVPSPENPVAPDSKAIEVAVSQADSPYFYPKLFSRYMAGDTTLNLEEYRHLYYGYVFNDNYKPLEVRNYADSVMMVLAQNTSDSLISPILFDKILYYCGKSLEHEPFNLNFINLMTYVYQNEGNLEKALEYSYKLRMLKNTIYSSGTGISKDSPWHVLYRSDQNDILNSLGAIVARRMYITVDCEYYHLLEKNKGNKGYYFDVSRLYLKRPEGTPVKSKRRFEFNPYQNPKSDRFIGPRIY